MIHFTQYLRPDGRKKSIAIFRPDEIQSKADRLEKCFYCVFEIEELRNGTISMTVEQRGQEDHGPVAMRVCNNGARIPEMVDEMILEATKNLTGEK